VDPRCVCRAGARELTRLNHGAKTRTLNRKPGDGTAPVFRRERPQRPPDIERGVRNISLLKLHAIAKRLGVAARNLMPPG
jgi:hypothetical protein